MWVRAIAAAAVLVSGAVHLKLWWDGFRDIEVIGPSFLLNAVAAVVIAAMLPLWRHWVPLFLAVGFGAATLAAFVVSTTVGLFGVQEQWTGAEVFTAAVSEVVAVLAGVVAWLRERWWRRSAPKSQHRTTVRGAHLH